MQILLDIKMPPSSLEQFKGLDKLEKNNQKSSLETQKSQKRTDEIKKKSTSTEKGNLKGKFLGPFNNYPGKRVAHSCQQSVASISSA